MTIVLVGAGNMGEALLAGWLNSGWTANEITVVEPRADRRSELDAKYGVATVARLETVATDILVLAVKPQTFAEIKSDLVHRLAPETLVVSIMAGISTRGLARAFPDQPAIRVMPNMPAQVSAGVSAVSVGEYAAENHLASVLKLLAPVGSTVVVDETLMDAVTAISGSGPAYLFYLAESLIAASQEQGLSAQIARQLVIDTLAGSAALLQASTLEAADLRRQVTSPGGTTSAAINEFEAGRMREIISSAITAAAMRSRELGQ